MSEMCDISNETKDEPHTDNKEVYILPDREVSETEIKQEDMELADAEHMNKETDAAVDHIKTVPEGTFVCSVCDKSFTRKASLKNHIETVHEGKRAHACHVCFKSFAKRGNLKQHIERGQIERGQIQCNKYL